MADFGNVTGLVPVPLHASRLHERGFNQAELLARELSGITNIPVKPMLVRHMKTAQQARLTRAERLENVRQAFAIAADWVPMPAEHLVLVDDVATTGATLHACVDVLLAAGVAQVSTLTLALDMQERELQAFLDGAATT
jgi:ComF family protein